MSGQLQKIFTVIMGSHPTPPSSTLCGIRLCGERVSGARLYVWELCETRLCGALLVRGTMGSTALRVTRCAFPAVLGTPRQYIISMSDNPSMLVHRPLNGIILCRIHEPHCLGDEERSGPRSRRCLGDLVHGWVHAGG